MLDSQDYADFVARRIDKYIFWTTLAGFNIGERLLMKRCTHGGNCVQDGTGGGLQHGSCNHLERLVLCGTPPCCAAQTGMHSCITCQPGSTPPRPAPLQPSFSSLQSSPPISQRSRRPELWAAGILAQPSAAHNTWCRAVGSGCMQPAHCLPACGCRATCS